MLSRAIDDEPEARVCKGGRGDRKEGAKLSLWQTCLSPPHPPPPPILNENKGVFGLFVLKEEKVFGYSGVWLVVCVSVPLAVQVGSPKQTWYRFPWLNYQSMWK